MKNPCKTGLIILIIFITMGCASKKMPEPAAPVAPPEEGKMYEVMVKQVVLNHIAGKVAASTIILVNKENDKQVLPIMVGISEGRSINMALQKEVPVRPGTHDLFASVMGQFDIKLIKVVITDLREDTYIATMKVEFHDGMEDIDARPSDAIAIALRSIAPIFVSEEVIRKGGWLNAPKPAREPVKMEKRSDML